MTGATAAWTEDGIETYCWGDLGSVSTVYVSHLDRPWQWPTTRVGEVRPLHLPAVLSDDSSTEALPRSVELQTLSLSPPIFRARRLLPEDMLDELRSEAEPAFEPSTVGVGSVRKRDDRRRSSSAWLHGYQDPTKSLPAARAVQRAVAALLRLSRGQLLHGMEPLLAVQYAQGGHYEPHHDFFATSSASTTPYEAAYAPPDGSNRFATVIIYLTDSDSQDGGHTVFPYAVPSEAPKMLDGLAFAGAPAAPPCDFSTLHQRRGLMVQPRRGDALLFYNQLPNGTLDGRTRHGACPVLRGAKVAINVWAWNRGVIYR